VYQLQLYSHVLAANNPVIREVAICDRKGAPCFR